MPTNRLIDKALPSLIGAMVACFTLSSANVLAASQSDNVRVKCYGVAKAGQNDCGTATHSCAGKAAKDRDPAEWKYALASACKTDGGTFAAVKAADNKDSMAKEGMAKEGIAKEGMAKEPMAKEPMAKEPMAKEPMAKKAATKKTKKKTVKKQAKEPMQNATPKDAAPAMTKS